MANNNQTIFQRLTDVFRGSTNNSVPQSVVTSRNFAERNEVLFTTNDRAEYEKKLETFKQQKYLAYQWKKAGADNAMESLAGYNAVKLMYRDVDLMDGTCEIGSALDIISEEACPLSSEGVMLNVYSRSQRTKSILEDLFVNRLHIYTELPMIARHVTKYGNTFMLLNIDKSNGVMGWMMMPVYEVDREENGYGSTYTQTIVQQSSDIKPDDIRFVWKGHNGDNPYFNWQVAHFRLLNDSFFLPYGCIVGDSRIETENGYKEIDSIEIGDKIWTFNVEKQEKELSEVTMSMFKGFKDVYMLKTKHNFIEATDDHKFLCYENNSLIYKELKDIKINDLIIIDNSDNKHNKKIKIDKSNLTEKEANLKKSIQWWSNNLQYIPDFVDEEFADFFGFMIGDGWINNNSIHFAIGEYNCFNKKYIDYLHKITNKEIKLIKPKNKINYDISEAFCESKCLKTVLRRMGFNGKFNEKRIPEWVFKSNDNIKKSFLNGLMTADGSYNIDKFNVLRCCIELSNEQLIKDVKTLVQSLGYKSGQICSRNRIGKETILKNGKKIKTKNSSFYFYFFESKNTQEKKYDIIERKNLGFKTEKVVSINYSGKKKTYDITVENKNSNFFANGIVTHNCSLLHKARRAWRMWSMMEDAMLIWRLDKAIERRVYKVYVGAIDDADVPAYINEIANNFKRTQIIDPMTGQVDLRKNFLDVSSDYFIPVRREDAPNPIETLQAANSQVQMEDIEYMQNKIFAAMRVPKTFLNFQEAQGKGQNLSFMDIRFARMINRIQQFLLMELNKIAMIHLYIMDLQDEIGNFSITLNSPSTLIESQELDDLQKRLTAMQTALADPGTGMPMMSMHRALKKIMKMSDNEIRDMFNEIRLEKAMAAELAATANIIKHTGMFDITDRIYGDYNAMHGDNQQTQAQEGEDDGIGGGGGGSIGGGPIGDIGDEGLDIGEPGADETGDVNGEAGETDMAGASGADTGMPMENRSKNKNILKENGKKEASKSFTKKYFDMLGESTYPKANGYKSSFDEYMNMLSEGQKQEDGVEEVIDYDIKNATLQENIKNICDKIDELIDEDELKREELINEAISDLGDFSGETIHE